MAKNTHFQNWQADSINKDRCPVCWNSNGFRSRSNYCSDRCVEVAKAVRDRIRASAVRFQIVGFTLTFEDGVYPVLGLPSFMEQFYPDKTAKCYPIKPRPINERTALIGDFWSGMVRELGWSVGETIATVTCKPGQDTVSFRREFEEILKDVMFLQKGVFICPDCGGKYFDGELTRGAFGKSCCDVKQAAFPF